MSQHIYCPQCKELNKVDENFCHNCGTQLKLIEHTEQQSQAITQNQYPTIKIKPAKPRKISNKLIIFIIIAFCLGNGVLIAVYFGITAWFWSP